MYMTTLQRLRAFDSVSFFSFLPPNNTIGCRNRTLWSTLELRYRYGTRFKGVSSPFPKVSVAFSMPSIIRSNAQTACNSAEKYSFNQSSLVFFVHSGLMDLSRTRPCHGHGEKKISGTLCSPQTNKKDPDGFQRDH